MDEVTIRLVIAVLLWLAAAVLVVGKLVISLGHAFYALQNDTALASDNRAPLRYAVTAMLAASLAVAGFLVWVPELVRLLPFGLGVILLLAYRLMLTGRFDNTIRENEVPTLLTIRK
ncbi:MAG: hypothetical protein IPH95_02180 [Candidatus Promineofilum sp.]|nr:hypothetical protein [Promineifilum sp.]